MPHYYLDNMIKVLEETFIWKIEDFTGSHHLSWHDLDEPFSFDLEPVAFIPATEWRIYQHLQLQEEYNSEDGNCRSFTDPPESYLTIQAKIESEGMSEHLQHFFLATSIEIKHVDWSDNLCSNKGAKGCIWNTTRDTPALRNRHFVMKRRNDMPTQPDGSWMCESTITLYFKNPMQETRYNFRDLAMDEFASLLEDPEETGADVTIVSEDGKEFKAHKAVLIARSPVLKKMLTSKMDEGSSGDIRMEDISSQTIDFLLHYMYKGVLLPFVVDRVNMDKPCISEVIYVADKYMLKKLLDYFDENLGQLWCKRNRKFLFQLTELYNLETAKKFIENHLIIPQKLSEEESEDDQW